MWKKKKKKPFRNTLADTPDLHVCSIQRYIQWFSQTCEGAVTVMYFFTLHYITLHYITLHYITLHYITLHYITLHYITLHYTTLHYITLHYIYCKYIIYRKKCRSKLSLQGSQCFIYIRYNTNNIRCFPWYLSMWKKKKKSLSERHLQTPLTCMCVQFKGIFSDFQRPVRVL